MDPVPPAPPSSCGDSRQTLRRVGEASDGAEQPGNGAVTIDAERGLRLSVLISTLNERKNLPQCLDSLPFEAQIVVVDSGSTDGTVEYARSRGLTVVQFPGADVTGKLKRTWALEEGLLEHDWVLVLDADERLTPELANEIRAVVANDPSTDGYFLLFRIFFFNRWLSHCGWYPAYQLRLFRKGRAAYERSDHAWTAEMGDVEVHERIVTEGSAEFLKGELLHNDYRGLTNWITKHNRYSSWEAARRLSGQDRVSFTESMRLYLFGDPVQKRKALRRMAQHLPFRPLLTFIWMYVVKRGFLDGYAGFLFCTMYAVHQMQVDAKTRELQARGGAGGSG